MRLFVNILTRNEKYSLSVKASVQHNQLKCKYLEMTKYSLNFLSAFQESTENFEYFGTKDEPKR